MRITLAFMLALAWSPSYVPKVERTHLRVKVGETRFVRVTPVQVGFPPREAPHWTFRSTKPHVARIEGRLTIPAAIDVPVTGVSEGEAGLVIGESMQPLVHVDVYCDDAELVNATPEVQTRVGHPVTLRVVTPDAERTAFTWYRGHPDAASERIEGAAGPELVIAPQARGTEHYWVRAMTSCSRKVAEFVVEAQIPKQRAARR